MLKKMSKPKILFMTFICGINFYLFIELSKSFEIKVRDKNKRTNLGKIYLDKI